MIKLKDILFEGKPPSIFVPRRVEDRVERLIKNYIRNGSKGNLSLQFLKLTELPAILKDITVGGNFYCGHNKLTSLINAPKTVGESFYCNNNLLTSLAGVPSSVGEDFDCSNNKLTSLINAPKFVGGTFYCENNKLTSLEGASTNVGGGFYCRNNTVQFTVQDVRAVCDVKGKIIV